MARHLRPHRGGTPMDRERAAARLPVLLDCTWESVSTADELRRVYGWLPFGDWWTEPELEARAEPGVVRAEDV